MAAMLSEIAASWQMEYRILSLNDAQELHRMRVGEREFVFTGAARGKARFAATALRAARRHPRIVLAGHVNLAPVVWAMQLAERRIKSIVCAHGIEVWEPLPALRRRALRRASLVLAPSRATADYVISLQGVPRERVRVLPWGLDPEFESASSGGPATMPPPEFPPGRVVLTVGRWLATERYKGMDTLITALPRLLLRWPELQLVFIGTGDDRQWLESIARDTGVNQHVHFLSGLTYDELSACYAASEIFALPSWGEGFGFVYLEAMAQGKPVIGGAHGGAPEIILDGVTGYVVPHGDPAQLAASIGTLLSNPLLARQMGACGRERVNREFCFSVFAVAFRKILGELCES